MFGMPGEIVGFLVLIAFLAFTFAIFRWAILASAHHKSTISHAQAARELGFEPELNIDLSAAFDGCHLFHGTVRTERKFTFCYVGQAGRTLIRVLEFQLDRRDPHVLGIRIPMITTVLVFEAEDLRLPKFVAQPRMLPGIGIPHLFDFGRKVLIDDEFGKDYTVTDTDGLETDLRSLFGSEVRNLLKDHRMVVESIRNQLILYYPYGKVIPNQLWKEHLEIGARMLAAMHQAWKGAVNQAAAWNAPVRSEVHRDFDKVFVENHAPFR